MRLIRIFFLFVFNVIFLNFHSYSQDVIDFQIKGIDDGIKSSRDQDYQEALIDAKMKALEMAGVEVKSETTVEDYQILRSYIESKSEALILPGMNITDIGYLQNGSYQVFIVGKIQTSTDEDLSSKEIRYAKSLMERNKYEEAKELLQKYIEDSDEDLASEAFYFYIKWGFSEDFDEDVQKFAAFFPNSNYMAELRAIEKNRIIHDERHQFNLEIPTKSWNDYSGHHEIRLKTIYFNDTDGHRHSIVIEFEFLHNGRTATPRRAYVSDLKVLLNHKLAYTMRNSNESMLIKYGTSNFQVKPKKIEIEKYIIEIKSMTITFNIAGRDSKINTCTIDLRVIQNTFL